MLRDEYKKQMDNIRADESVKEKVLNAIKEKPKKTKRSKVVYFRAAAAMAASIAVALSVIIVKDSVPQKVEEVGTVKTYSEVYKTLEALVPKTNAIDQLIDTLGDFVAYNAKNADDVEIIEEEYVYEAEDSPTSANGAVDGSASDKTDYSETTTQVKGVDEADIVKTDGKYIYSFNGSEIKIIKAGKTPQLIKKITVASNDFSPTSSMYLADGKLIIIGNITNNQSEGTVVNIYDVSDPQNAKVVYELKQSGFYNTSRLIGDKLYLISNYTINANKIDEDDIESFVPCVDSKTYNGAMAAEDIFINRNCSRAVYTVICGYGINDGSLLGSQSVLGGTYTLYCSTGNIITADYQKDSKTNITRFAIDDGKVEFKAEGTIDGSLLNQFSIDEYKGYFRFVTTENTGKETRYGDVVEYTLEQTNALTVLDGELKMVGEIDGIAPDERVYSVRFMGDTAYFVTFRQVDPLFSVDLSDPHNPKIIGALKIPGFSNYLYPFGDGKLLGIGQDADEQTGRTGGVKLSMFDISDPANVSESAKLILDVDYSSALQGHKESLVDYNKNIIGFSVWGKRGSEYRIFGFENGAFTLKSQIKLDNIYNSVRGLYIGEEFYIITDKFLYVYDINSYNEITRLSLS